jgi:hypothetical protein
MNKDPNYQALGTSAARGPVIVEDSVPSYCPIHPSAWKEATCCAKKEPG